MTTHSLRETLATNPDLRRKAHQAAALAAYNVIKAGGIVITAADVAEAQADIAAMKVPADTSAPVHADTAGDIINAVGVVSGLIGSGF